MPIPVPHEILALIEDELKTTVVDFKFTAGGCINHGGRLETTSGDMFIKWNDAAKQAGMFLAESRGLKLIAKTGTINVPEVIFISEAGDQQFILMEWIEQSAMRKNFWSVAGSSVAAMHLNTASYFGLDHDNYIGSLRQSNEKSHSWLDFFIHQRLQPQLILLGNTSLLNRFEKLYQRLPHMFPVEKPALVHGDLWGGNLLRDAKGLPSLIDPAVYYGNREAELAFTQLFGGFGEAFYKGYADAYPLAPGYPERVELYNLYPLLVHTNLFGGSYLSEVEGIISRWE